MASSVKISIAPWLTIPAGAKALEFYQSAFGAEVVYRHDDPSGGLVVKLSVRGAEYWLSQESTGETSASSGPVGGESIRLILTVPDPDEAFARAIQAGATEVFAVGEGHGWRLGRLVDPFGLHWEIGHPLAK